ncbi:MAG: amino acid ABC transporter substrate-binding protein [Syntrophorhabdales bacterium]|jgi:branched-chain amino acid transport system substrate-binding protein
MKSKHLVFIGIVAVFSLVLLTFAGAVQGAEKKGVTLGYSVCLTGKFSPEGNETQRAYQLWLEQVGKAGGLQVGSQKYPIKVIMYDDESDPSMSVKLYEKLITGDKVDLILSPWSSGNNFAASAVAEKYHYPIVMSAAAANAIFERGFKYIFETTQLATTMMEPWLSFLKTYNKEIKTVAVLYENHLFPLSLNESMAKVVQEAGAKLVLDEKYPIASKDFTGIMLKVKGLNPDAVFVLSLMPSPVYATRQANEVGVKPKLFMVNFGPMYREEFIVGLGDVSEKVYENGFWHPNLPFAGAKEFARDYEAKFKRPPTTDAAYAYIACQVLEQAVKKAGSIDKEKVAATLHKEKFQTILGPYEYDERGINKIQRGFICQVQNKKRVIVWPSDLAEAKPEFMR